MAYRNNKAEVLIEFKQVGVKSIEDVVKSLDNELVNLKKVIGGLELKPSFINRFGVLNKEINEINQKILNFKNKIRTLQDVKVTPKDLDKVRKEFFDITKLVGSVANDYNVLKQAIGQTEKGIKKLVQANLENLKAYTRSKTLIKGLEEEYKKLITIKEKDQKIGNLVLFNKSIEDRINALNFYKTKLKEIKDFKLDSNLEKELVKPLDSFRKAVQNASYPVDKLNERLNELENEYKSFGALIEKRKKLMSSLFDLRVLGKSEEEINKLKQKIDELFKKGIESKNIKIFDKLEVDLAKFSNEAQITFKNAQKYSNLYLQALENIHKASKIPFIDSNKIAQYDNEIKKLYDSTIKTGNSKPLALLNKEIKQLINSSLGLVKASDTFERLKSELKKLGVSEVVLGKFEKDFQKLAEESKSLGKTTFLGILLKDMRALVKEAKGMSAIERKIKNLKDSLNVLRGYGVSKDTVKSLVDEFNVLSDVVKKTGDVSVLQDFEKRLNAFVASSKNLREVLFADKNAFDKFMQSIKKANPQEIKLFDGLYKDAYSFIKEIERVKNKYMKTIQNLQTQISSRKEFANEKDIKEAQRLIEQYTKKIEELTKAQEQLKISMRTGSFNTNIFGGIKKSANESIRQLNKFDLALTKVKARLQETSFTKFIKHITKMALGYSALYMGIYQVISAIQRGFGFIVQMNEAVSKMSAVFDISASRAKQLEERLVRLGIAYGGDIKSINEIAMALGRAGLESNKLVEVTEYVIKMSKLTGDQFETTANALITYIHNYKQAGVSIKQLADELTYVANASKLSTEDINTFSNYALATAKSANITRHFIEALAIAFSNAGFEASTIGTSIRRLGIILQDNSTAVKQFFKSLGVSQQLFNQQVNKSAKDSERMMVWLIKRLKNMSSQEFQQAVSGMEVLARQTLSAMRNQAPAILEQLKVLNKGVNGELDKSNVMLDTYIGKWERLKNSLGLAFNGLMQNALPILEKVANKNIEWLNAINNALPQIQRDLSNIWTIVKGISAVIVGWYAFKGIKFLKEALVGASIAGLGFLGVIKKIGSALGFVVTLIVENPYVALAVGAVAIFTKLFFTVKNVNEELARANSLLAQQQKLNGLVSRYDMLIAKKQQFKKQLAEAIVDNDRERVKLLTYQLNKIEKQLEDYKRIIKNQEESVKQKQKEIDKAQKYVEYQLLSAKLERLRVKYNKTNSEEISKQITLLEKQLEKLKQYANYKPSVKNPKPKSVFQPYHEQIPLNKLLSVKGNVSWENTQPNFNGAIAQSNLLNQKIEKMKQNLNLMKLDTNPLERLNKELKDFENKFGANVNTMKKQTKKGLIKIVSKEEVQRFQQMTEKIKYFLKQGLDVSDLTKNLNKEIDKTFKSTMNGLVKSMEISFKQAKISKDALPADLNKEFDKFKNMMKNATNPKDVVKLEAEFLRLKLLLDKTKGSLDKNVYQALKAYLSGLDKDFANLEGILKARIEGTNALLSKTNKKPLAVKGVDYQAKDIFSFKDFGVVESEVNKLADKLRQSFNELKQVSQTGRLPIKDDLIEAQKEVLRLDNLYKTYYNQRVTKEKEYYNLIAQIKSLKATGFKDEEQRTQLLSKKKQLESEIKGLYQKEEELKKSTLNAEIKEVRLKQQMSAIIAEMNRETKAMNNPANNVSFDIQNKMYEDRKKLSIVNFNVGQDKEKLDAYFSNISAYISTKEQELKQKQEVKIGISAGQTDSGTAGAINAYQQYQKQIQLIKQYYDEKKALIQAKELEIKQEFQAGRMSEVEATRRIEKLKTEAVKEEIEKRKELEATSFNASLSAVSGYIGQFAGALNDMMRAGLLKQKKWFRIYKALRVAETIIDTYTSAQRAMAELPYPLNGIAAGVAIATGMMRVAVIKAQKFHTGGYVDRQTANKKMGGLKDDEIPAILQKGEYVLSREEVKAIKTSGNTTPQVNVTAPTPEVVILNSVDPQAFEEYLTSRSGRDIVRNIVGR